MILQKEKRTTIKPRQKTGDRGGKQSKARGTRIHFSSANRQVNNQKKIRSTEKALSNERKRKKTLYANGNAHLSGHPDHHHHHHHHRLATPPKTATPVGLAYPRSRKDDERPKGNIKKWVMLRASYRFFSMVSSRDRVSENSRGTRKGSES